MTTWILILYASLAGSMVAIPGFESLGQCEAVREQWLEVKMNTVRGWCLEVPAPHKPGQSDD